MNLPLVTNIIMLRKIDEFQYILAANPKTGRFDVMLLKDCTIYPELESVSRTEAHQRYQQLIHQAISNVYRQSKE